MVLKVLADVVLRKFTNSQWNSQDPIGEEPKNPVRSSKHRSRTLFQPRLRVPSLPQRGGGEVSDQVLQLML